MRQCIRMEIAGLGIICYSPFAAAQLRAGQDYLTTSFTRPEDVAAHVLRGDISAFCTGSPGHFELVVSDEPLDSAALQGAAFKVRLCLEVRDSQVCFRDLYDLLRWSPHCPDGQSISLADGFYLLTVYTSPPASGIVGDGQRIDVHFDPVGERPELRWAGVPQLC